MKHTGRKIIGGVIVLSALAGGVYAFYPRSNAAARPDTIQRDYPAAIDTITASIDGSGSFAAREVEYRLNKSFVIEEAFVSEGQQVQKGDALVRVSKQTILDEIRHLKSKRKDVNSRLANYQKMKDGKKKHTLSEEELDFALANTQQELDSYEEAVSEMEALRELPVLTAKGDGVVKEMEQQAGDTVEQGSPYLIMGETDKLHVKVNVSQEDIGRIDIGQQVDVHPSAYPDQTISGKVVDKKLLPQDADGDVVYEVIIELEDHEQQLLEGMTCDVKFIVKRVQDVLTLSNKAIHIREGKQYVYIRNANGGLDERQITTGFSDGRVSEILSGMNAGDIAVVEE